MSEFVWPCDKRIAHGPHKIETKSGWYTCPGVRAHPNTMIGRPGDGDS